MNENNELKRIYAYADWGRYLGSVYACIKKDKSNLRRKDAYQSNAADR